MSVEIQIEKLDLDGVLQTVNELKKEGLLTEQEIGDVAIVAHPYEIRTLCEEINEAAGTGPYSISKSDIMDLMSGNSFFSLLGVTIKPILSNVQTHEH